MIRYEKWIFGLGCLRNEIFGYVNYESVGLCFDLGLEKEERRKNKKAGT